MGKFRCCLTGKRLTGLLNTTLFSNTPTAAALVVAGAVRDPGLDGQFMRRNFTLAASRGRGRVLRWEERATAYDQLFIRPNILHGAWGRLTVRRFAADRFAGNLSVMDEVRRQIGVIFNEALTARRCPVYRPHTGLYSSGSTLTNYLLLQEARRLRR